MNEAEFIEISDFMNLLADRSKVITLEGFNSNLTLQVKDDGSPVTDYDINSEKILRKIISAKFPNHNIFAEEMGFTSNNSDYTWIIDPIDGTRSYVIGRPLWGTLISLAFKGEPIIGMADFPALDERWIGYKNKCLLNNVAFKKNYKSITSISEATVGSTGPHLFSEIGKQKYETLIKKSKYHVWSGDCHNYCLVIKGGLDLVVEEGLSSYDILPLIPILKSKDIIVTDWKSKKINLKNDLFSKYSVIVARDKNIYDTAINYMN